MREQRKKRRRILRGLLAGIVTILLVLAAVFLILNRDLLNLDTLRRRISYRSLERSDTGQAESFPIDNSSDNLYYALDDDLFLCSDKGVRLYSDGGVCYVEDTILLDEPAVEVCGDYAAVYSVGGNDVYLYSDRTQSGTLSDLEGTILSVRLNAKGWLAVTTQDSGYKAVINVYDSDLEPLDSLRLSTAFVMDAAVTEDCKSLAVVAMEQTDTSFESELELYSLSANTEAGTYYDLTPSSQISLGNNVIVDLFNNGSPAWLVGDTALNVWNGGSGVSTWDYGDLHLRSYAASSQMAAMLMSKYQSGSQNELYLLDTGGTASDAISLDQQVISLSVAGRYAAVLTSGQLQIYTKGGSLYASLDTTDRAKEVVMRSDGSAFLIRSGTAQLYIP